MTPTNPQSNPVSDECTGTPGVCCSRRAGQRGAGQRRAGQGGAGQRGREPGSTCVDPGSTSHRAMAARELPLGGGPLCKGADEAWSHGVMRTGETCRVGASRGGQGWRWSEVLGSSTFVLQTRRSVGSSFDTPHPGEIVVIATYWCLSSGQKATWSALERPAA